nr:transmembrane protease serine 9-like [Drosophila kikkawai]
MELSFVFLSAGQIYPICIDLSPTEKREVGNANTFDAYGWGKTRTANISEILQRVTLDHYDRSRCNRIGRLPLTLNQICAGSSDRDTCDGDSGGPLIQKVNYNGTRHLTQVGMVSYGLKSCEGLGVYTDVTSYADWIEEKIESLFSEYSSPTAAIVNTVSIRTPTETAVFGAENFVRGRLLFKPCGTSLSTRIMNGYNAEPEAAAWMARIHSNETGFVCGGTVIHRRFVLTAAHCLRDRQEENLFVELGGYDIRLPAQEYSVRKKIIHDGFDLRLKTHDIGLLLLSRVIEFSWQIYPICIILNLQVRSKVERAFTFDAYGWGRTNSSLTSNLLQKVNLDRYDRTGGPLTKKVIVNGIQRHTQFGITSIGTRNCNGIGVYTDVTIYDYWIDEEIEALFPKYSRQSSPTAIAKQISIRPPTETAVFGAENFGRVRLLFEPCGTRIINGYNAEPEAAAWMAGIHYESEFICSGTVIHRRFVLTAAQCLIDRQEENLFVKLGEYDIRLPVRMKIIYDGFDRSRMNHDIGLLLLSRDIDFSRHLFPICIILNLEVRNKVESAFTFDAYGWGRTNTSRTSNLLQKVTLDRYDRSRCREEFEMSLSLSQICAGSTVGDTCDGDSGGPLTKKVILNGIQRHTQFGITSIGTTVCNGIAVYTDVTSYVDWILEHVRKFQTNLYYS